MTTRNIEKELLALEAQYWQAIKDKDARTIERLTDDTCIVAGAQGIAKLDRKALAAMADSPGWSINRFELQRDAQIRMLGDDIAILAYKVREDLTVDGKPITIEASDASVWRRRDNDWVCSLHTESLDGDPFGRDRKTS